MNTFDAFILHSAASMQIQLPPAPQQFTSLHLPLPPPALAFRFLHSVTSSCKLKRCVAYLTSCSVFVSLEKTLSHLRRFILQHHRSRTTPPNQNVPCYCNTRVMSILIGSAFYRKVLNGASWLILSCLWMWWKHKQSNQNVLILRSQVSNKVNLSWSVFLNFRMFKIYLLQLLWG